MLQRIKDLSLASSLALSWLAIFVMTMLFNWRVGFRLLPAFAFGFFVYLAYLTWKTWPRGQKETHTEKTKTTEETKENE